MNLASDIAATPGWYGKLPTLGDFASRRLEADFIEPWDLWLGEGLQAQRDALGEGWLDAYLQSPVWRFVLQPGALASFEPSLAIVGILMPSVDRVGRYFPLTIAASMRFLPGEARQFDALLEWLRRLEDTGLAALQQDWTIGRLEEALVEVGSPIQMLQGREDRLAPNRRSIEAALSSGGFVDLQQPLDRDDIAMLLVDVARPVGFASVPPGDAHRRPGERGVALWLADTGSPPRLLLSRGLPAQADFVAMFSGAAESVSSAPPTGRHDETAWPAAATSVVAGAPNVDPDGSDVLGLFASPVPRGSEEETTRPVPLGAWPDPDATAPGELTSDSVALPSDKSQNEDILALFDATPQTHAPESELETRPGSPDILDLFGTSKLKPDFDKTR
ncbi:MAG TPA: type VI secretion system-associated protein TagF [Caldimonas sp.]|nr:type VI secretion system-associated protein TagF [Caldimonas sp.]